MASIKEIKKIIESTPVDQPIMLQGIHGIGKSESIRDYFEAKGYTMITLFVGQMADAGDLIGLPDRTEVELEIGGKIVKQKFTEFCPPKWWPTDPDAKVIVFFDEVNRGKPEIMQCLMDMVLNRKLNGLDLPKQTRIIGAVNPLDEDAYYQVEDLDPAFLDRWNVYPFKPTVEEWIDWAVKVNVNKHVVGFIVKHNDHLDPPIPKECKSGQVYPSRRSWKKVSDYINLNEGASEVDMKNYLHGVVGMRSAPAFARYLKEVDKGLYVGTMITNWSDKIAKGVESLNTQDVIYMNREIAYWFEQNQNLLKDTEAGSTYALNLQKYLNLIPAEAMAEFFGLLGNAVNKNQKWPLVLTNLNKGLAKRFLDIYSGDDEEEINDWD